jgi:alpha-L-fucosidase 2
MSEAGSVNNNLRLWYTKPAAEWNEALPIGNGRLGGMIFGAVGTEHIQLNEDSVWYGGPIDRNNPDALANLPEIRRLLLEGRVREAERMASLALAGRPESQRHYEPLGDLHLSFDHGEPETVQYIRELDLNSAVVGVGYPLENVGYHREYFSSAADQVMVIRLTADHPGSLSFTAVLRRGRYLDSIAAAAPETLMMQGNCGKNGVEFYTAVRAIAEGGKVQITGESLRVERADTVTLLLSAATTFRHVDAATSCLKYIESAAVKTYDKLKADHMKDYQSLFHRMSLQLEGTEAPERLPTDERLERVKNGLEDPELISLYFQFGRYLLISCSRPGTLPATLQGIWNKDFLPPWDSKYTININTEMNYWHAETCNLAECHLPLFDMLERMREPGRKTARVMYDCRGFTAHHNTDIWADTVPQDNYIPATFWPMGAAWLCLHLWEHYEFNGSVEFLNKAYGMMKEAAEFFFDYLMEDSKGRLVTCPSVSPENSYRLENGESGSLCIGPSMDSQILHALFSRCIWACEILEMDSDFAKELKKLQDRLPQPQIGQYGQLLEWAEDYEEVEPGHRHISHLFALHPGNQITVTHTPELAAAARKTLERRLAHGGGHTGWSRAWIINMWARLEDGEKAYENVLGLLRKSTLSNLLDNHPPFQIDGNFGGTAGIAEMLLHSHAGELHLLPALPKAWAKGKVKGLRARGGYELDMEWADGELASVWFLSSKQGHCKMRYKEHEVLLEIGKGQRLRLDGRLHYGFLSD